ncbi:MAG: hypothetical protein Q9163_000735 [Psora crenata]
MAIPLWNRTLDSLSAGNRAPPRVQMEGYGYVPPPPHYNSGRQRFMDWVNNRRVVQPEPGTFKTPAERRRDACPSAKTGPPALDLRKDYGRLQVIVKLANIILTPEKPCYKGGSWHVEGQANESICATALYYYDCDNISESLLAFRQQVQKLDVFEFPHVRNDFDAVETILGFEEGGPSIQNLGKVVTREGRLLTFPNVMQHQVQPFRLADPTRPGYRKILALFLVDPNFRIISTANVPPQQKAGWVEAINEDVRSRAIPQEIVDRILEVADFPITLASQSAEVRVDGGAEELPEVS